MLQEEPTTSAATIRSFNNAVWALRLRRAILRPLPIPQRATAASSPHAADVVAGAFARAAAAGTVDALIRAVDEESSDFIDVTDAVRALPPLHRASVLAAIGASAAAKAALGGDAVVKVICDLDNTLIETPAAAAATYAPGEVIPGAVPLLRGVSRGGETTVTFLSARPNALEVASMARVSRALRRGSRGASSSPPRMLLPFSFASGSMRGAAAYAAGVAAGRDRRLLRRAFAEFARAKWLRFERLAEVYPGSRFVFLGDDSQGDYAFAHALTTTTTPPPLRGRHFAVIRRAGGAGAPGSPLWPGDAATAAAAAKNQNIAVVSSWFEAIATLPDDILPPRWRAAAAEAALFEHAAAAHRGDQKFAYTDPERAAAAAAAWIPSLVNVVATHNSSSVQYLGT